MFFLRKFAVILTLILELFGIEEKADLKKNFMILY